MDARDILSEMIHSYGLSYGGVLDKREADALRAALTPWISWMVRPHFQPLIEEQLISEAPQRGAWTITETELIPPRGFEGEFPRWAYDMTSGKGPFIVKAGLHFWRESGFTHSKPAR